MRGPSGDEIERGEKFVFQIDAGTRSEPGGIFQEAGVILWRYEDRPDRATYSPVRLFRKPMFVLKDPGGREILQIRRISRFPTRFEMTQDDQVVGRIVRRSILRNKYFLEFRDRAGWTFKMPLFTVYFHGESTAGDLVWVEVGPSRMQWNILLQPGMQNLQLLAGLAFIHRECWRYG